MTEYLVVKPVMLSFMNDHDQYDCHIESGSIIGRHLTDRSIYLKSESIWRESITDAHAITVWLVNGTIIENL
jgi:hypothetical protein